MSWDFHTQLVGTLQSFRYWGFIEEKPNDTSGKKNSGYWRITPKGRDFVLRKMKVWSHVLLFNDEPIGFEGSATTITDALGRHFDYQELMRA